MSRFRLVSGLLAALAFVVLVAVWGTMVLAAKDKYTLQVPNGLPFSDFRGYEDWQVVTVSQTDELLKAMVANPVMIDAYKAGVPGNGKPFPDGSKIAKIEWKLKKSTEAPFSVNVFPDTKGWAYAVFDYDPGSDTYTADPTGTVNCGFACHTIVASKDYIFHSYQKR